MISHDGINGDDEIEDDEGDEGEGSDEDESIKAVLCRMSWSCSKISVLGVYNKQTVGQSGVVLSVSHQ